MDQHWLESVRQAVIRRLSRRDVLRGRWTWPAQRWLNRGPRVATNELVMEVSGGR